MVKPVLVFGYGNLSRGDDALGPLLLDYVERELNTENVDILCDFQLQIEHALDLQGRERVLFVDAAANQSEAFAFDRLQPERDLSYTTHAMSPAAVLQVYQSITGDMPPPSFLLSIAGSSFELGQDLSAAASANLTQACCFAKQLLQSSELADWGLLAEQAPTMAA